mgnify:FL=1
MAHDAKEIKTALWLQPKPGSPLSTVLKRTITGLAPVFEDAPIFEPHVTISTGIYVQSQNDVDIILDSMLVAAQSVDHFNTKFTSLTYGSQYFRKVVFEVEPTAPLFSMARIAQEEFSLYPTLKKELIKSKHKKSHKYVPSPAEINELHVSASEKAAAWIKEYKPHLSLVYSNMFPVTEAIRHTVNQRLIDVFGPQYTTRGIGWTGGQLALVNCEGPAEEWKVLGTRSIN